MLRAYVLGAAASARRWPLLIALWVISAAFGLAFAIGSALWLADALDGSLATRTLWRGLDANVLIDLWYHHREGLRGLLVLAGVLAAINLPLWWWLHGVIVASLRDEPASAAPPGGAWTAGLLLAPVMARLFVIAIAVLAIFSAAVGGVAYVLLRWTRPDPSAFIWYEIGGAAVLVWTIGTVFLVAVHDHARLRAARAGAGALAAYRWAFGFVLHGGERAFLLACLLQLTGLALWAVYQAVAMTVPIAAIFGLAGSLLWGEAFLLARLWLRVWFFAAQNELQA